MSGQRGRTAEEDVGVTLPVHVPAAIAGTSGTPSVQAIAVSQCSCVDGTEGLRPATLGALAAALRDASAREPGAKDPATGRLHSGQPERLAFTVACRPGEGGVAEVALDVVNDAASQSGGVATTSARANVLSRTSPATVLKWSLNEPTATTSPATGRPIAPGTQLWLSIVVDTWTGAVVDLREVLYMPGSVTVTRSSKPPIVIDMSSYAPVRSSGETQVMFGIDSAVRHFFGPKKISTELQ
jgi:hypothetical protein